VSSAASGRAVIVPPESVCLRRNRPRKNRICSDQVGGFCPAPHLLSPGHTSRSQKGASALGVVVVTRQASNLCYLSSGCFLGSCQPPCFLSFNPDLCYNPTPRRGSCPPPAPQVHRVLFSGAPASLSTFPVRAISSLVAMAHL
jgi:hypothetical protein